MMKALDLYFMIQRHMTQYANSYIRVSIMMCVWLYELHNVYGNNPQINIYESNMCKD
jgi:hypothetical protein